MNPYENCPILETDPFLLRLVRETDAEDLLSCYADKDSLKLFNNDNCPMDFYFESKADMYEMIKFWLYEYSEGRYVRFSIVDKTLKKAIGTLEMFAKEQTYDTYGKVGVLRVDLPSSYEKADPLDAILGLVFMHFGALFNIDSLITKSNAYASTRTQRLLAHGFSPLKNKHITSYEDYYIKKLDFSE